MKCRVGEMGPVVSGYSIRDPKPTDDGLDYRLFVDLDHRGHFP
jgi:hypothetical protein